MQTGQTVFHVGDLRLESIDVNAKGYDTFQLFI